MDIMSLCGPPGRRALLTHRSRGPGRGVALAGTGTGVEIKIVAQP